MFLAGSSLPFFGNGEARFLHYLPGPTSVMAPTLAYPLIWLGLHLPSLFQRIGARNDYSYGVYIYGWPVLQLLGIWGVQRWGYTAYTRHRDCWFGRLGGSQLASRGEARTELEED